MMKLSNKYQIYVICVLLIVGNNIELIALTTPEMVESVLINIEANFFLFPITEFWFIMHNIAVDGCSVLLIGS